MRKKVVQCDVNMFDLQALQARRIQCEHQNVDPLVWTSHRVIKWIRDIDLKVGTWSNTVRVSSALIMLETIPPGHSKSIF